MKPRRHGSHLAWALALGAAITAAFVAGRGSADAPPGRYTIQTDDTVRDDLTGLIWQRDVATTARSFEGARTYCEGLALAPIWRVPSVKELQTIVDYSTLRTPPVPMIDPGAFPNTPTTSPPFWTSSAYPSSTGLLLGYVVNFVSGSSGWQTRDSMGRVRCVR